MIKGLMVLAALNGLLAVGLGAFASHGLKHLISSEMVTIFALGVQYHFYHVFAMALVALCGISVRSKLLYWSGGMFMAGIGLFSGSLYVYALLGSQWMGPITPLGGLCFMLGWSLLAIAVWRSRGQAH
ncbi:DUF423 domain-containing protein [Shewanella sp. NIFS-20-20]|uniref:DUF423 domain-containing protein n=1 Tax=Shewanella sp. NIFS-20-20 TaxID=2853806 RepID=UPI001C4690A5|nr:DUF423 domain-containing protein [Shewanella sp. NIFS-20-20]MBV7315351.1 DUF423 domain-containing protein [Shewanella sp. NIFS-20-20]